MGRLEATISEGQDLAVRQLAEETGLSRSQIVGEAVGLFLKVYLEAKNGRRVVTIDPLTRQTICELVTPTLSALEWAQHVERVQVSPAALETVADMVERPTPPTAALRDAMKRAR